jgi:RDD family
VSESGTSPTSVDRGHDSRALLPASLVFADTPSRFVAYFLDGVLIGVINAIPLSVFGFYDVGYLEFPDRGLLVWVSLLVWAIQIAYFLWFWTGGRRATPGQRLFSIQVGNAFDGQPLSLREAVIRFLGYGSWITIPVILPFRAPAIGSLVALAIYLVVLVSSVILSPTKQGLHDRLAGSALVRPAHGDRKWAVRVIWIALAILAFYAALFLIVLRQVPNGGLPSGYWQRYLDWLWPS